MKKSIQEAQARAQGNKQNLKTRVIVQNKQNGEVSFKLDSKIDIDPSLRKIAGFLLKTDIRKHNRYCPCCQRYEEG